MVNEKKTWQEARQFCQTQGLDLAVFENSAEHKAVVDQIMRYMYIPNQQWWIGVNDRAKEGSWVNLCNARPKYLRE